ncbi:MAG: Lrp/AsnC family transcriptional regulator [Pseudomonadota bacterium]
MIKYDDLDRRVLVELQRDASRSIEELGDLVGLSRNAVWRRVKRLEDCGLVKGRVALVDPDLLGLGLTVFISVRTDQHDARWSAKFASALRSFEEVLGVYRTSGAMDYLIRARVADVKAYDRLYQRMIEKVDLQDVSASFVMEEIKETTALPVR